MAYPMLKYLAAIFFLLGIISCSTPKSHNRENPPRQAKDSLTYEITRILEQGNFNGFGVAIVNSGGTLYEKGFGYSDLATRKAYTENTIQNIASISKTFIGVALMKAVEMGRLKLDDPISKYLPFKVVNPYFPDVPITIRHLANHTSTIIDNESYFTKNYFLKPGQDLTGLKRAFDDTQVFNPYDSVEPMPSFLKDLLNPDGKWYKNDGFLNRKPGEIYEYSNTGATLAAYIIELATGMPFDDFTRKYILKPLKMNASGWKFSDVRFSCYSRLYENPQTVLPFYGMATYPDGNFITSIKDLSKYLTELIKGYNGTGTILSKESYAELFRQQLSAKNFVDRNERNPYSESYNVGVFMGFGYTGYIGHTGGDPGVVSIMFFDPRSGIGRLMIFNTGISDKQANDAFYSIWNVLEKYQAKL